MFEVSHPERSLRRGTETKKAPTGAIEEENEAFVNVFMVGPGGLVWVVKFSIETSGGDLWDSVRRLWNEIHPGKRNNLEYIDMRFLPRAYYK